MSHNFPCSPQGGKLSQLNPTGCIGKTILGGTYDILGSYCCFNIHSNSYCVCAFSVLLL